MADCAKQNTTWLTVYPLRRIHAPSTSLFPGLRLLSSMDYAEWASLRHRYPRLVDFQAAFATYADHPLSGETIPGKRGSSGFDPYSAWLVAETHGTQSTALHDARSKMAAAVGLVCAFNSRECPALWSKGSADHDRFAAQFAVSGVVGAQAAGLADVGPLLPSLHAPVILHQEVINNLQTWFRKLGGNEERVLTAAEFLRHALLADGTERFVNLFKVVEALSIGCVGAQPSFTQIISAVSPVGETWRDRCQQLDNLRRDLMSGTCTEISKWTASTKYTDRFGTLPMDDAIEFAATAVIRFPRGPETTPSRPPLVRPVAICLAGLRRAMRPFGSTLTKARP